MSSVNSGREKVQDRRAERKGWFILSTGAHWPLEGLQKSMGQVGYLQEKPLSGETGGWLVLHVGKGLSLWQIE